MAVDFDQIPECVWKLFDSIMWADPANRGQTVTLTPSERSHAYVMAWGWNPPLLEVGNRTFLTQYGLAAWAWKKEQPRAIKSEQDTTANGDVPAKYREGGKANGEPLTSTYLLEHDNWSVVFTHKNQLTRAYKSGKLTDRIRTRNGAYAYLYTELAAIAHEDSLADE